MKSLRFKITLYFIGLIVFINLIFTIGMNNFIDDYYYGKKIEAMNQIVRDLDKMYEVTQSEDEALMNIEYLSYHFDGKISIVDRSTKLVIFNSKDYQYARGNIIKEINYHDNTAYVYETAYPVEGARWLIYIDELENDKLAILQVSVVAIDEALAVIQSFFNYLMMVGIVAALVLAFVLARNISSPIMQLQQVANGIGSLKFNVKYKGKRNDEIGKLGNNLNKISDTLENTIEDLQIELEKGKNVDRMRRRFVAQVSHELQTPISVISSYVEALNDGIVEEDEIDTYYKIIEDESSKMSKIVKDLLQLSQLESGTLNFKKERIELIPYLEYVLQKYQQIAHQKALDYSHDFHGLDDIYIVGDSLRLEQGITNILTNAFKHSDEYVTVDLTRRDNTLMLIIENSGESIDSNDLIHVFDSFYKGRSNKKVEGTGLGLSIASKIFDRHQMKYRVYNKTNSVVFELLFITEDTDEKR